MVLVYLVWVVNMQKLQDGRTGFTAGAINRKLAKREFLAFFSPLSKKIFV